MSYSIIFETKMVDLSDGRILHLDLSGCNNDTSGRSRGDFTGKIYTQEEMAKRIEDFKKDSVSAKESESFDLKIGSRYCTWYDYGAHLERMVRCAVTWGKLKEERYVSAKKINGYNVNTQDGWIFMTLKEFENYTSDSAKCSGLTYRMEMVELPTEEDVVKALDENAFVYFYVDRKRKGR